MIFPTNEISPKYTYSGGVRRKKKQSFLLYSPQGKLFKTQLNEITEENVAEKFATFWKQIGKSSEENCCGGW